jgi:type VI secretion system secreted protein Hcp
MKTLPAFLLAIACLNSPLLASTDIFLKVDGIPGESNATGHTNEIVAISYKIGAQQTGLTNFVGGGGGAGKSQFTPLTVYKIVDLTSPALFVACALGKPIPSVTLSVAKNVDVPVDYFKIILTNVVISSVSDSGEASEANNAPIEAVSFSYQKIQWVFTPTGGGVEIGTGFDVKKNVLLKAD